MKKTIIYFLMAMFIYSIMIAYTLPTLRLETGGVEIFDMRPGGYSVDEGILILNSLSDRGLFIYRYIQLPLDFIYPLVLFLFAFSLWKVLFKKGILYRLRWMTLSVVFFDYMENVGIYWMLGKQTPLTIRFTSFMSIVKAMSTTVVMTIIMVGCLYRIFSYMLRKGKEYVGA